MKRFVSGNTLPGAITFTIIASLIAGYVTKVSPRPAGKSGAGNSASASRRCASTPVPGELWAMRTDSNDAPDLIEGPAVGRQVAAALAVDVDIRKQSVMERPTIERPVVAQPIVAQPNVAQSSVGQPVVERLSVMQPHIAHSTVQQPSVGQSGSRSNPLEGLFQFLLLLLLP